jgi:hypothetical protein
MTEKNGYAAHLEPACGLLQQGVPLTDELLASIAISLKRIADGLNYDRRRREYGPTNAGIMPQ